MTNLLEDFVDFLTNSPTSWHTTTEMGNRLASIDFTPLSFDSKWNLEKGKRYFVIHDGSLAAFILPENTPKQMAIVTSHTDSPALKLKPHCSYTKYNMNLLGVEVYGDPVLSTWLNRDLAITGRVIVRLKNSQIEEYNVFLDEAPVIIPTLAPHLDRNLHKQGFKINPQKDLIPFLGLHKKNIDSCAISELLKQQINFESLLEYDLFLVPIDPPRLIGNTGELLSSYRLDNLASCHSALTAIANITPPFNTTLPIALFWDHEEIGSQTSAGAHSPFFNDLYQRICNTYKIYNEDEIILRHNSQCLSVDLTHAINPAYEKNYDSYQPPLLGEGIVLKHHAGMRYTTSARSGTLISLLCKRHNLNLQHFLNRSDIPTGSTVGPIFASQTGIKTADLGIPQLSMHSAREVIACQDHLDMCTLLTAFLKGGE